jgi:hypothetical protein
MSEKELIAKMDAALAHVDPDRRKFLGILLAGVAAAPLLASADLAAQNATGAHFPKTEASQKANMGTKSMVTQKGRENATWTKGGVTSQDANKGIKNDSALKSSNGALKNNNSTIKSSSGANTQLKFDGVNNNKASTGTIKNNSGANTQLKNNSTIKNSSGANSNIKY